jgi:hypothetical protein
MKLKRVRAAIHAVMTQHLPRWAATQKRLNAAPLGREDWDA